jgi:hypothetical protein
MVRGLTSCDNQTLANFQATTHVTFMDFLVRVGPQSNFFSRCGAYQWDPVKNPRPARDDTRAGYLARVAAAAAAEELPAAGEEE